MKKYFGYNNKIDFIISLLEFKSYHDVESLQDNLTKLEEEEIFDGTLLFSTPFLFEKNLLRNKYFIKSDSYIYFLKQKEYFKMVPITFSKSEKEKLKLKLAERIKEDIKKVLSGKKNSEFLKIILDGMIKELALIKRLFDIFPEFSEEFLISLKPPKMKLGTYFKLLIEFERKEYAEIYFPSYVGYTQEFFSSVISDLFFEINKNKKYKEIKAKTLLNLS